MRGQNAVIKFYRSTGQLKWILGPPANWGPEFQQYLLTPVGSPFEWQYGQHAPLITPQGTLMVYDDGNYRASPFDPPVADANNFSRAVEYDINQETMEVSQVWDYGRNVAEPLYTDRVGNADWLPQTRNVLVTFGYVAYDNGARPSPIAPGASMVRIKEVTHGPVPEVVFDLAYFDYGNADNTYQGYTVYRSHRISDLYAHPPQPVADLMISFENGIPRLLFSADETRTYTIEASTDLVNWQDIGTASQSALPGSFEFDEEGSDEFDIRYYRVLSQ
jgi:arylsulfate sulfotransferase